MTEVIDRSIGYSQWNKEAMHVALCLFIYLFYYVMR